MPVLTRGCRAGLFFLLWAPDLSLRRHGAAPGKLDGLVDERSQLPNEPARVPDASQHGYERGLGNARLQRDSEGREDVVVDQKYSTSAREREESVAHIVRVDV